VLGFAGVALGAFGAHALVAQLTEESRGWWDTATLYVLPHAAAALAAGLSGRGGRTALVNPGNRELLLATVAWLADRKDLLDGGISGREVPRIEALAEGPRRGWMFGYGGALVLGPIVAGAVVLAGRRRRA
jgi:hypothetical protein